MPSLVTCSVPPDDSHTGTLHEDVERTSSVLALVTLLAALLGVALAIVGRAGGGICASVGLFAAQVLAWAVLLTSDGGASLLVGFWLASGSLAVAAALHLTNALRARRRSGAPVWGYATARVVLVLLPTLALVALVVASISSA